MLKFFQGRGGLHKDMGPCLQQQGGSYRWGYTLERRYGVALLGMWTAFALPGPLSHRAGSMPLTPHPAAQP